MKSIGAFLCLTMVMTLASIGHAERGQFPTRNHMAFQLQSVAAATHVNYYGGAVLSHVKVYAIFWGNNVDAQVQSEIGNFYTTTLNSTYMDWLQEYNTRVPALSGIVGTNQDIGRGTFGGNVTINPSNNGSRLDKTDVQVEIEKQIDAGKLPVPDKDTLFMVHFPAGITLLTGGIASCQAWCGDHEGFHSTKYGDIYYAMMPDITGACATGCGFGGSAFDSMTVIASHEVIESVTDPMCPDIGQNPAFPAAWLAADQNEIGDLCVNSSGTVKSSKVSYAVQGEWDNSTSSCKGGVFTSP